MNKWVLLACFLLWARHGEGGALKCLPEDDECSSNQADQVEQQEIDIRRPTGAVDAPAECAAGSEWNSNCHHCRCSDDGEAQCLRQAECNSIIEEPIRCQPNSTFERDCNTCVCLENGLGLCTIEQCQTVPTSPPVASMASLPMGEECAVGSSWQSQCNDCVCSPDGRRHCTERACPGQESEPSLRCAPQTHWKRDCNRCWCNNGLAMCTKMGCVGILSDMNFSEDQEIPQSEEIPESNNLPEVPEPNSNSLSESDIDDENNRNEKPEGDPKASKELTEEYLNEETLKNLEDFDENDVDTPNQDPDQVVAEISASFDLRVGNKDSDLFEDSDQSSKGHLGSPEITKGVDNDVEVLDTSYVDYNNQNHRVQKRSACKPNQEFRNECNTCKCSTSGQSYTCTQNECMDNDKEEVDKQVEVFMESEGGDHIERHSVCKPSTIFYVNCNQCHCNAEGTDFSCTNKACPLPVDVEVFHELHALLKSAKNSTKKVCVENRMFIMNCNTCWCNEDGTSYFCTRRVCVPGPTEVEEAKPEQKLRIIKRECRPDEVFELDCNMCRCNPDGKSFSCTRRACFENDSKNETQSRKTRAISQEPPKTCKPGQEFRLDCNKCLCDNEGQDFSCTRIDCTALNNNNNGARRKRDVSQKVSADCIPGSVFDQSCNVCRCTEDGGHATCTLKRCAQNKENSTLTATESSFRCNPGEQFKQSCNDCSCSADGKSVFCTLLVCDEDLTP